MNHQTVYTLLAALTLTLTGSANASTVTASHVFPTNGSGHYNVGAGLGTDGAVFDNRQAQTFTARVGGYVSDASFIASRLPVTNVDLRVSIAPLIGGQPGLIIGSTTLNVDSFADGFLSGNPDSFTSVADFRSERVLLVADREYAMVFGTDTVEANYRIYGDRSGYTDGEHIRSQNGSEFRPLGLDSDLFFEITVIPVPEPSTSFLATVGFLSLLRRRKSPNKRMHQSRDW